MLSAALSDLENSGISVDDADYAGMFTVKDASEIYSDFKAWPALAIPYIDPWTEEVMEFERDGELLPFCRVRYYHKSTGPEGFKKRKERRYTQPAKSGVRPYFPIVHGIDWMEIGLDPTTPIMVTEGEKKALAACLAGVPTIGLGGVYNFAQDGELLEMLADKIEWAGRAVYICYDSDAGQKIQIQVAEGRLATELSLKRQADVFLVRLPGRRDGHKVGVDDFLVQEGDDALLDLLSAAPEMRPIDKAVLRLNDHVAWIEREGKVLDMASGNFWRKGDFTLGSEYSSLKVQVPSGKGGSVKEISVASKWLHHPHARRYSDVVFRPASDDKTIPLETGKAAYNMFRGLPDAPGDVKPFFALYGWLMSDTPELDHDLIWKLIAYKMQNLEARVNLGVMLLGDQGGGKSLFCDIMGELVGPYHTVLSSDDLSDTYNGWMETSLIVVINESEARKLADNMARLKTYITDENHRMNEKYRVSRQISNFALYLFNSNERNAGAFSNDDRRMIVVGCPKTNPAGDTFYDPIYDWFADDGARKLLHYFRNYDLEGWIPPRHAPDTYEKRMAYNSSLSPVQKLGTKMLRADEHIVVKWLTSAMDWAGSEEVSGPQAIALASDIRHILSHIQIRPFYTPEELAMMFPAISNSLMNTRQQRAAPSNFLAQELLQQGIKYLRCQDDMDGFMYKGVMRQYLIVSDVDDYSHPISQREFDRLMEDFPTYKEWRLAKRKVKRKR